MKLFSPPKGAIGPKERCPAHVGVRHLVRTSLACLLVFTLAACSTEAPTSTASSAKTIAFEAENAALSNGVFAVVADTPASANAVLMQPASVKSNREPREDASIHFEVDREDHWTLWSRVRADSRLGDTVFVGLDGEMARVGPETLGEYVWLRITSEELAKGQHRISLGHAEGRLKLDMLIVTNRVDATAADLERWRASNVPPIAEVPTIKPQ